MRGFLLSLDALVAIGFLFVLVLFLSGISFTYSVSEFEYQRLYYSGKDMLNIMKTMSVDDIENRSIVEHLLSKCLLNQTDIDKTVLDIVGSLWANGELTEAEDFIDEVFGNMTGSTTYGYEILMDGVSIYLKNTTTPARYKTKLSTIASGYMTGEPVSGFVARSYLETTSSMYSEYVYFGGYEGDGNVTKTVILPDYDDIISVYMEMDVGGDFTLYINDEPSGHYTSSGNNMSADIWYPNSSYFSNFERGNNTIKIGFDIPENNFIGGGYIRITYNGSEIIPESLRTIGENASSTDYLPGIEGIINVYSSFYVPGQLNNISAYLHFNSTNTIFFAVGNKTVYEGNGTNEMNVTLEDGNFSGLFDYDELSKKTIPIRIGLKNVSYTVMGSGIGDTVLSTDVSGSMDYCVIYSIPYTCHYSCIWGGSKSCVVSDPAECTGNICEGFCFWPYGHWLDCIETKLDMAKDAAKDFVDVVLNESIPGNRVGLNAYKDLVTRAMSLTNNKTALHEEIEQYTAYGGTCICCGVEDAITELTTESNSSRRRSIVIMSDGMTNVRCYTASADLNDDGRVDAKDDAIQSACNAYNNHNITVYTVAFGYETDNETLRLMAECGNGKFYFSNTTLLAETFKEIAEEIVNGSYTAQTVMIEGNITSLNKLYHDSYIKFNYTSDMSPVEYGQIILTFESKRFGNLTGNDTITDNITGTKESWYYIPDNTEPVNVKITSYSSNYWTDRLYARPEGGSWERVYWLADFNGGVPYIKLGDPYIVTVPVEYVGTGNNSVKLGTGTSSDSPTGASVDDKVIYTLRLGNISQTGYSTPFSKSSGSTMTVYYDIDGDNIEDGSSVIMYGPNPGDIFDPTNDAIDDSFLRLMDTLNFVYDINEGSYGNGTMENPYDGVNTTNPIEFQITQDEVNFEFGEISGVPSLWGPANLEIVLWS